MSVLVERRVARRPLPHLPGHGPGGTVRAVGLGVITGAADDDPSAIGTYASAGALFGTGVLWAAPALLPLMAVTVYMAAKLGQVSGQGLAAAIRARYPRGVLAAVVLLLVIGNTIEAGADLGGIAASVRLLLPVPELAVIGVTAGGILALQIFGSYRWIRRVFRWLALALLAYAGAAILAHPPAGEVVRATLWPRGPFGRAYWTMVMAMIGTSLSPYLFVWQASHEVEEDVSLGRRRLSDRKGTTAAHLRATAWDVMLGMFFTTLVMYFILLAAAATLYPAGLHHIQSAAEAARALQPLAGPAAGALFAAGVIGAGMLAVPVMTVGAAYVGCEAMGWKSGLSARPREAREFYAVIAAVTAAAVGINLAGVNPMRALVGAGLVQGALAPVLILLLILLTGDAKVMGPWRNRRAVRWLGWLTFALTTAAVARAVV